MLNGSDGIKDHIGSGCCNEHQGRNDIDSGPVIQRKQIYQRAQNEGGEGCQTKTAAAAFTKDTVEAQEGKDCEAEKADKEGVEGEGQQKAQKAGAHKSQEQSIVHSGNLRKGIPIKPVGHEDPKELHGSQRQRAKITGRPFAEQHQSSVRGHGQQGIDALAAQIMLIELKGGDEQKSCQHCEEYGRVPCGLHHIFKTKILLNRIKQLNEKGNDLRACQYPRQNQENPQHALQFKIDQMKGLFHTTTPFTVLYLSHISVLIP